jgi:uncharacterized protein
MHPLVIDAFEFCRFNRIEQGEYAVADLGRLTTEAASNEGVIRWSLAGDVDPLGHPRLKLSMSGTVQLMCQRCLTPFALDLSSESVLLLAADEDTADHIEELQEDEDIDVIVVGKQLNVTELVEDEALLAIPVSPKHEKCPSQALSEVPVQADKAPSPFEALKNWKR